jgi:hypothetical protein
VVGSRAKGVKGLDAEAKALRTEYAAVGDCGLVIRFIFALCHAIIAWLQQLQSG